MEQGKDSEAIVSFERALVLNPTGYQTLTNVGLTYVKIGRLEEGVQALEQAVLLHTGAVFEQVSATFLAVRCTRHSNRSNNSILTLWFLYRRRAP